MKCRGYENLYSQIHVDVMVGGFIHRYCRIQFYRTVRDRARRTWRYPDREGGRQPKPYLTNWLPPAGDPLRLRQFRLVQRPGDYRRDSQGLALLRRHGAGGWGFPG